MSRIIGRLRKVGIAKEATKGTGVAPTYWLPVTSQNLNPMTESINKEGAIGRIENSYDSDVVKQHNEPSLEGYVNDKGIGLFFLAGLGSVSSEEKGGDSGVYDHTFSVLNSNEHPALTLSFKDDNIGKWTPYAMLQSLELQASQGDYLRYVSSFVSKYEADQSTTPSFSEENIFISRHITVKIADTEGGLSGASALTLQDLNITFNKNVEAVFAFGSDEPSFINNKEFEVTGSLSAVESDTTWRDLFSNHTTKVMQITITNSDVTIGSSSNPKIVITLYKVKFNSYSEDVGLADLISESVEFKGHYSVDDTKAVDIVLTNEVSSY